MILLALQAAAGSSGTSAAGALAALIDKVLDYAILLAAVGSVAMALLEAIKKLFDFRARFHSVQWTAFMKSNGYTVSPSPNKEDAFVQLLQLACGVNEVEASEAVLELAGSNAPAPQPRLGKEATLSAEQRVAVTKSERGKRVLIPTLLGQPKAAYSVFSQPTEQMVATLGDAADVALASPKTYESLFRFLVRGARQEDIDAWTKGNAPPADEAEDPDAAAKKKRAEEARQAAGALSRLRLVARRKLAAFQVFTAQSWASWNQLWANVLGVVIMAIVLSTLRRPMIEMAVGAIFGGVLSPVAKDVVSALSRAKSDLKQAGE